MTKKLPLVTVIIPTYNRAGRVMKAVNSVLNQTYPAVQLIVVDDGSTDQTEALLGQMERVKYVKLERNSGQAAARNVGLSLASGEMIASLDSDDYWNPDFLKTCVQTLVDHDLDFVFANWYQAHSSGNWTDFLSNDPFLRPHFADGSANAWHFLDSDQLRALYLQACPSPSSSVVMRRSSIVSGWDNRLKIGDDWCLYLDMIIFGECRAAFTLHQLWYKDVDGQNIYDGRVRSEVVRLLFIEDTKLVLERYQHALTLEERKILAKRYMGGLVEYAKHLLVRDRQPTQALSAMQQSFKMGKRYTFMMMLKVAYEGLANHTFRFWGNKSNAI